MVLNNMEFCPKCGSMLMPKEGIIKCACGYEKSLTKNDLDEQYRFEGEKNKDLEVIVTDNNNVALPTTRIRSADEAPTNFIRCAKCGNTWRSSN